MILKTRKKKTAKEILERCRSMEPISRINMVLKMLRKNSLCDNDLQICKDIVKKAPMPDNTALMIRIDMGFRVQEVFCKPVEIEVLSVKELKIGNDLYRVADIKSLGLSSEALQYHCK